MIVVKIGGVLSGSVSGLEGLLKFISDRKESSPVVVTSAFKGVTDFLVDISYRVASREVKIDDAINSFISLHSHVISGLNLNIDILEDNISEFKENLSNLEKKGEVTDQDLDVILRFGEDSAVCVISNFFNNNIKTKPFTSNESVIITDESFGSAGIIFDKTISNVKDKILNISDSIPIVSGFVGRTIDGKITTTGRNSSDYTACFIACALNCSQVFICKDTEGIMDSDPNIVSNAKCISRLSFKEALEISELGGKVIHPRAIRICKDHDVDIKICKLSAGDSNGTLVSKNGLDKEGFLAIGCKAYSALVTISSAEMVGTYGFLEKVFHVFAVHKIPVDVISTSESSISVTVDSLAQLKSNGETFKSLIKDLQEIGVVDVDKDCSIIGVITTKGYLSDCNNVSNVFSNLAKIGHSLKIISQSREGVSLCFVVEQKSANEIIGFLHKNLL